MIVYVCGKCCFSFRRTGIVDACPFCGNDYIRKATKDETVEFNSKNEIEPSAIESKPASVE